MRDWALRARIAAHDLPRRTHALVVAELEGGQASLADIGRTAGLAVIHSRAQVAVVLEQSVG